MVDVNGTVYHLRTDICSWYRLTVYMSPRNGEVILKTMTELYGSMYMVSVPAMGR